jgi:hypothetical protein
MPLDRIGGELRDREDELLDRRHRLRSARCRDAGFWAEYEVVERHLADVRTSMAEAGPTAAEYVAVRQARPASHTEVAEVLGAGASVRDGRVVDETLALLAVGAGDPHVLRLRRPLPSEGSCGS